MFVRHLSLVALSLSLILGCDCHKSTDDESSHSTSNSSYSSLPEGTVVLKIGEFTLTKGELEREVDLQISMAKLQNQTKPLEYWKKLRPRFVGFAAERFICRELFRREAAKAELKVPDPEDLEAVQKNSLALSGQKGKEFSVLKDLLGEGQYKVLESRVKDDALVQTYLKIKFAKDLAVSDEDYARYSDYADKVLQWQKVEMEKARELGKQIVARFRKGESFADLADEYSFAVRNDCDQPGGVWGEFLLSMLLDDELRDAVRKTPIGECTEPIETPEGLVIVLVEGRAGSGDPSSVNLQPETCKMRRIVLRLPRLDQKMPKDVFVEERIRVKFREVQDRLLERLRARTKVEYPFGSNVWVTAETPSRK